MHVVGFSFIYFFLRSIMHTWKGCGEWHSAYNITTYYGTLYCRGKMGSVSYIFCMCTFFKKSHKCTEKKWCNMTFCFSSFSITFLCDFYTTILLLFIKLFLVSHEGLFGSPPSFKYLLCSFWHPIHCWYI